MTYMFSTGFKLLLFTVHRNEDLCNNNNINNNNGFYSAFRSEDTEALEDLSPRSI